MDGKSNADPYSLQQSCPDLGCQPVPSSVQLFSYAEKVPASSMASMSGQPVRSAKYIRELVSTTPMQRKKIKIDRGCKEFTTESIMIVIPKEYLLSLKMRKHLMS